MQLQRRHDGHCNLSYSPANELAEARPAGVPPHPVEQIARRNVKRTCEFDQRVHPTDPFATLDLADSRAMQRSHDRQLFLGSLARLRQ